MFILYQLWSRSMKHQLEDIKRQKDAIEIQCEATTRENQRGDERVSCISRSLEQAENDNVELTKEKTVLNDRITKLEGDLMKGIKALQHQEVEIDALVRTKGNLQDCVSQMKERLLTADSHNTRLIGEIEEFEKKQQGIILYHSSIF